MLSHSHSEPQLPRAIVAPRLHSLERHILPSFLAASPPGSLERAPGRVHVHWDCTVPRWVFGCGCLWEATGLTDLSQGCSSGPKSLTSGLLLLCHLGRETLGISLCPLNQERYHQAPFRLYTRNRMKACVASPSLPLRQHRAVAPSEKSVQGCLPPTNYVCQPQRAHPWEFISEDTGCPSAFWEKTGLILLLPTL